MGAIAGIQGRQASPEDLQNMEKTLGSGTCLQRLESPEGVFLSCASEEVSCIRKTICGETYELAMSGNICNLKQVLGALYAVGCRPEAGKPEEILLMAFEQWGVGCFSMLRGGFSMAIREKRKKRLYLVRDQLGICPLFYYQKGEYLVFASRMETILKAPKIRPVLDREGILELVMLGPGRKPGSGILKGIRELEPGTWALLEDGRLRVERYWELRDQEHRDSREETLDHVRFLVERSVRRQIGPFEQVGAFLSGGLDSSILTALCARERGEVRTFSVDYQGNDRNFKAGKFEPESDDAYITLMRQAVPGSHSTVVLGPEDLMDSLKEAEKARDFPGMGDVDSSLLCFCRKVREEAQVVLSGECADEIFGGYPWFRNSCQWEKQGFPWAQNVAFRQSLLGERFPDAGDFSLDTCLASCRETDLLPTTPPEEKRIRELTCLNMKWFMQTLLERNDRMSSRTGLKVLVPFCDVDIAQYLYHVPWSMKNMGNREKGLLREAFRGLLPEKVLLRKKSPYPKTFDPRYETLVSGAVEKLLKEKSMLWEILSRDQVIRCLEEDWQQPFYGQLMRRPQFMAWLLQLHLWLKDKKPDIFL